MNLNKLQLGLWLGLSTLLAGCGSPGAPLPPSLELASPVSDLRAVRKGDRVYLTWTPPAHTTDRQNVRHPGATEICRSIGTAMQGCADVVAKVPPSAAARARDHAPAPATYTDQLSAEVEQQNPTSAAWYAVSVLNSYGRSAGLSNQVQVPAAPAVPPPSSLHAQLGAEGVNLSWDPGKTPVLEGLRFVYRVYRREQGGKADAIAAELPVAGGSPVNFLDRSFEWEKTYEYRVTVVTLIASSGGQEQQVEGDDSPPVQVVAHDVFPPARPEGLQAVSSGPGQKPFIDLVWNPNGEADLAGYNVFRREAQGQPVKLNGELIKAPAFRDDAVQPGRQYFYSVSAVDVRGNESALSEETGESVPEPQ